MRLEDMKVSISNMTDDELEKLIADSRKRRIEKDSDSRVKRVAKKQKSNAILDMFSTLSEEERAKIIGMLQ